MKSFATLAVVSAAFVLTACTDDKGVKPMPTDKPVVKPIEIKATAPAGTNKPGEIKVNVEGGDKPGMPKIEVKTIEAKPANEPTAPAAPAAPTVKVIAPTDMKVEVQPVAPTAPVAPTPAKN